MVGVAGNAGEPQRNDGGGVCDALPHRELKGDFVEGRHRHATLQRGPSVRWTAWREKVVVFRLEARGRNLGFVPIGVLLTGLSFAVFNFQPASLAVGVLSMGIGTA